jgi:hypothetical protein
MNTMTTIQKRAMICATLLSGAVTTLVANSHTIVISVPSGAIAFGHNAHDGQNGNVMAKTTEKVHWKCHTETCSSILIHFDDPSPCQEPNDIQSSGNPPIATCTIVDPALLQPYKYKITVNGTISKDPHVIVDNQVIMNPKPKPKKNR